MPITKTKRVFLEKRETEIEIEPGEDLIIEMEGAECQGTTINGIMTKTHKIQETIRKLFSGKKSAVIL